MYEQIDRLTQKYVAKVVNWRRTLHAFPELSGDEEKTACLVIEELKSLGIAVQPNVGGHGVVGLLEGNGKGNHTVALRADMDALPLQEETGLPFASQRAGVMHACGHDAHTAMLLGTASVLSELREHLQGNVKFLFQPAEEQNPTGGAQGMIRDGALEEPHVDALFGLHVWPTYETGKIALKAGAQMGASDRLWLVVEGRSAHGSAPQQGVDAIMAAAEVISGLQSIVSRSVSPLDAAVISLGTIHGGYRYNVIADKVELEGTVRTLSSAVQEELPRLIERTASGIAGALGAKAKVRYVKGYPPTINDPALFRFAKRVIAESLGDNAFVPLENPELGGEDFSFFARERPAVFAWLGCRPSGVPVEKMAVLHNTRFAPDEGCFPYGMRFLASCAYSYLEEKCAAEKE